MIKRLLAFGMILLLSMIWVQAQSDCTVNLTEEECELYETAWVNLRNDETLIFTTVLDMKMSVGVSEDRTINLNYGGIFERNQAGAIHHLSLQGEILAHNGDVWNYSWDTEYASIVTFFEAGRFDYAIQSMGSDLGRVGGLDFSVENLSLESFLPIPYEGVEFDEMRVRPQLIDDTSMLVLYFSRSSALIESPFALWERLLMGEDIDNIEGTGHYEWAILIEPTDARILAFVFNSSENLNAASLAQDLPLNRSTRYIIEIATTNRDVGDLNMLDNPDAAAMSEYEAAADYGLLGMMAVAYREELSEIYPPISEIRD